MNPQKIIIVLALTLLLSQTAIAVHDIHCFDGEHDQTCEIYFTQDHSANNNADQNQLETVAYGEKPYGFIALVSPTTFSALYLSRAPPYHRF